MSDNQNQIYRPEFNYYERDFAPYKQPPSNDMCGQCELYYQTLYEEGKTTDPFPPNCQKHVLNKLKYLREEDFESKEEFDQARLLMDPISWAAYEFDWYPRWYQEWMVSCSGDRKIYRSGRRIGKCLKKDTPVLTPSGPVEIQNLKIGDTVYNENGNPIRVKEVFDQGIQEVVDLKHSNQVLATCTLNHPWLTVNKEQKNLEVKQVKDFKTNTRLVKYFPGWTNQSKIEVSTSNIRKEHCFDLHVESETNLYLLANGLVTHNTEALVIETLHFLFTHSNSSIVMCAPREVQVTRFFDEIARFIRKSKNLVSSIERLVRSPARLEFKNHSKILGFTLNPNQGDTASVNVRGQDAHLIVVDELDFINDKDLDVLFTIKASHPECRIIAATTPSGQRNKFYKMCVNKDGGWKEFWFISQESPNYTEQTENFFRSQFSEAEYTHEVHAEFGEPAEGVFKKRYLDDSIRNYEMDSIKPAGGGVYLLGVDWNKSHGTHMVILQHIGAQLKLVKKIIIPESEYMQSDSVQRIIELNDQWNFKYLFLDSGYGSTQHELIKKHGLKHPNTGLHLKTHSIAMNKHLTIKDPTTGEDVKKFAKPYLVQQTSKLLEDGALILPSSEDTSVTDNKAMQGLVQQMRNYRVEAYSVYGQPQYTKENEHTLVAYMIACGGYVLMDGELSMIDYDDTIKGIEINGISENFPDLDQFWTESQYKEYIRHKNNPTSVGISRELNQEKKSRNVPSSMGNVSTPKSTTRPSNKPYKRSSF